MVNLIVMCVQELGAVCSLFGEHSVHGVCLLPAVKVPKQLLHFQESLPLLSLSILSFVGETERAYLTLLDYLKVF